MGTTRGGSETQRLVPLDEPGAISRSQAGGEILLCRALPALVAHLVERTSVILL